MRPRDYTSFIFFVGLNLDKDMLIQPLLAPISWTYIALVRTRSWLYGNNILATHRLQQPVICVGNLTMGGTGKTPTVIAMGHLLQKTGCRISVILRGYKGHHKGAVLLISDGKKLLTTAQNAGDEALVIARNLPRAIIAVAKNRWECGTWLEKKFSIDVHLLDDGYQHLKLFRNFNLLLIDVTNPWGGGYPPIGRLREPLSGIQRADAALLTRTKPGDHYPELIQTLKMHRPDLPVFFSRQKISTVNSMHGRVPIEMEKLRATPLMAFAGIGHPEQFFSLLKESQFCIPESYTFKDHHRYTAEDVTRLKSRCQRTGIEAMITTEKDAEKLNVLDFEPLKLLVARLEFEFDNPESLLQLILNRIGFSSQAGMVS
jgi:tetraacyldisaccharide 4'-kinase